MKNPCKKCLVKAACTVTCEQKVRHSDSKDSTEVAWGLISLIVIVAFATICVSDLIFGLGGAK